MVTISGMVIFVVLISLSIMAYILFTLHRMMSLLIRGTEHIHSDDFSQRIGTGGRKDEFALLASRFDLMAEHLQERDTEIQKKRGQLEEANLSLRDLNENLESRILERTSELEGMVARYRNTAKALEESKHRLEAANVDLIKANQAKANFLSIVSHELKTPLSVINGFLSLILDERYQNDPKNLREAVEISKRRGQQLARMIDELIDLSRLDANAMVLHREPVLVGEAFEDSAGQFQEDLQRKQLRLSILDCSTLPPVNCDPDKFRQIVTNLLSNAIKFSPEGSSIEIGCREEGESFLFHCRDQGIGIPAGEREKVFDKFYQVDSSATRRFGGAGLGLSIVKEIVHLHGGRIWVESDRSGGCTFFFTIPKDEKKGQDGEEGAPSRGSPRAAS
jgi:signal transduction histidine kinase